MTQNGSFWGTPRGVQKWPFWKNPRFDGTPHTFFVIFCHFFCVIPHVRASTPKVFTGSNCGFFSQSLRNRYLCDVLSYFAGKFRYIVVRQQLFFHDKRLIQYDCGKLQKLAHLLRALRIGGHKVLIFTQMTKMLDILESFLNLYGYSYCRLDGSTKPEQRQLLVQRFNTDARLFVFILSTRSGGFGINLTGADTVIFYDTDWNPAIDSQAQDRCHRIGQTQEVSVYRYIMENFDEEGKEKSLDNHIEKLQELKREFYI